MKFDIRGDTGRCIQFFQFTWTTWKKQKIHLKKKMKK